MSDRDLLLVVGYGLSGELDLTYSLAAHPAIVLGIHRFRTLWADRPGEAGPDVFERDRFFDFTDGLTTLTPADDRWRRHYDAMAEGWDQATYVGDMTTEVRPQQVRDALPGVRLAVIVRDPVTTVAARERRLLEEGRPVTPDTAERLVVGWNRAGTRIRRAARIDPHRVRVVEHHRFFSDPEGTSLNSLLRWLDLEDSEPSDRAFNAAHRRHLAELELPPVPGLDLARTGAGVDRTLWRDLQALAV